MSRAALARGLVVTGPVLIAVRRPSRRVAALARGLVATGPVLIAVRRPSRRVATLALAALAALVAAAGSAKAAEPGASCPNEAVRAAQGSTHLPDCRAYELVSPVAKNGTGVVSYTGRTRAAADGNALQFLSLGAFADAMGTGIATDYLSERTGTPGTQGWSTHAITPYQSSATYDELAVAGFEPFYAGEFSPDLSTGIFFAESPLTNDPSTADVPNLYLRTDLLSPGAGTYDLITHCPLCDATRTPLQAPTFANVFGMPPVLAWMSPDASHVAFESTLRLTADTPVLLRRVEVYQWDRASGTVALVGRVPRNSGTFCDDVNGPACVASQYSLAGQGASNATQTPDVVSDGTDGHTRLFFTFPTANGLTPNPGSNAGQLYMRVDGTSTVKLNVSERTTPDAFAPATFLDASKNGERVFFMTTQALTDDASGPGAHIYMYDASLPPSAPNHLTLINADHEPTDGTSSDGQGIAGLSDDGHYVYFASTGQIVSGQPPYTGSPELYLWHDGTVSYITSLSVPAGELFTTGGNFAIVPRQSRVTPDGRGLLYPAPIGTIRELYLYSADSGAAPVCVSCDPSGAPETADATDAAQTGTGATAVSWHENHALSDNGAFVFFSSAQPLVPEAVNGRVNVYEYNVALGRVFLISSGTSTDDSWFMDASADGSSVFFTTRDQLVGWDTDQDYDMYDARIVGGVPEPARPVRPCEGEVCQGALAGSPLARGASSDVFTGAGNVTPTVASKPKPKPKPLSRAQLLARALKACHAKRNKHERLACEKQARKRYSSKSSKGHR